MIIAKNLTKRFDDKVALDNISFEITDGSIFGLVGSNGSGKSTLSKHLNAILLPTGGKVLVDSIDTQDEDRIYDMYNRM